MLSIGWSQNSRELWVSLSRVWKEKSWSLGDCWRQRELWADLPGGRRSRIQSWRLLETTFVQWRRLDGLVEKRMSSEVCWRIVVANRWLWRDWQDISDLLNVYFDFLCLWVIGLFWVLCILGVSGVSFCKLCKYDVNIRRKELLLSIFWHAYTTAV